METMDNNIIDIDFLEIGTADFNTLIQTCDENTIGISVEPIKFYLDILPNKKNVKKIAVAITGDDIETDDKIHYAEENDIKKLGLPEFLKGCNKIGDYHPYHIKYNIKKLVKVIPIKKIGIKRFLIENKIRKIKYLKIDTEGCDTNIMEGLYEYIKKMPDTYHPDKITFETNSNVEKIDVDRILEMYFTINYSLVERNQNTTIKKNDNI